MRFILVIALALSLQACSLMDVLRTFSPTQPGVAVDAQLGDRQAIVGDKREQEIEVEGDNAVVTTDNTKTKQQFAGEVRDVTINDTNPWILGLLLSIAIAGWLVPRPSTMWRKLRARSDKAK